MALWNIVEIFRDSELLARVRVELKAANLQGIPHDQYMERVLSLPLLQSIHAELLRLRVQVQTIFSCDQHDIRVNEWRFPRKSLVVVPAGAAHRDSKVWNTKNGEHPLDQFWADRFLVHPDDPQSGPLKNGESGRVTRTSEHTESPADPKRARFVTTGLSDSFIPWGIGERTCPGRGFARREIISVVAMMVEKFDIEILLSEQNFDMSGTYYGFGTQRPSRNIPFRIRRHVFEDEKS